MKSCSTCYYSEHDGDQYPCVACSTDGDHWVAQHNVLPGGVEQRRINVGAINGAYSPFPKDIGVQSAAGVKYDNGKPQWSLLPFRALTQVVEVLTYGAKKYAPDNWKKVPDARRRYIDAGFRHFTAYATGETHDPETGKHHLAHAICCLLYLVAFDLGEHNDKSNSDV